jgi:hypothetical protein
MSNEADSWYVESFKKMDGYPDGGPYLSSAYSLTPVFIKTCIYSARGDKEKAMEYFRLFSRYHANDLYILTTLRHLPMFDYIRREPEFQDHFRNVVKRFQEERGKVEELLREEGIL